MNGERAFEIVFDRLLDAHETAARERASALAARGAERGHEAEKEGLRREIELQKKLIKDQGALVVRLTALWEAADKILKFVPAATDPNCVAPLAALEAALKATEGDTEITF